MYFSAEHVEGRIDAFLDEFGEILRSLSDEDFKSQVTFFLYYLSFINNKVLSFVREYCIIVPHHDD